MAGLKMIVTKAGRAALVNARSDGTNAVTVVAIGVTAQVFTPDPDMTVLPGESKRLATISGGATATDTIHVTVRDDSSDAYDLRGIALYLADGTLFASYGQANILIQKSAQAMMLLATDTQFADIDAAQLVFGDTNFQLNMATEEMPGVVQLATLQDVLDGVEGNEAITLTTLMRALLAHPRYAPGQVVWTAGLRALPGTLLCDGSAVSREQYASLFAEIGISYGPGDGATTFNVPRLDDGMTVVHTTSADNVGTLTAGAVLAHGHAGASDAVIDHTHAIVVDAGGDHAHNAATDAVGDHVHTAWTDGQGAHAHGGWTDGQGNHAHSGSTGGESANHTHGYEMRTVGLQPGGSNYNILQTASVVSAVWQTGGISQGHTHAFSTDWQGFHGHAVGTDVQGNHGHNVGIGGAGAHAHAVSIAAGGYHAHGASSQGAGGHSHVITVASTGGVYNLPAGVRMLACIAY